MSRALPHLCVRGVLSIALTGSWGGGGGPTYKRCIYSTFGRKITNIRSYTVYIYTVLANPAKKECMCIGVYEGASDGFLSPMCSRTFMCFVSELSLPPCAQIHTHTSTHTQTHTHTYTHAHTIKQVRKKGGSSGASASLRIGKLDVSAMGGEEGAAGRAGGGDEGACVLQGMR